MAVAGTLEYLISIDSSKVNSGLNSTESKMKGFGNKLSSWAIAKGQVLGRLIEKAGTSTISFVKGSINESKEFGKSMAQVAATLGKSTDEIQELSTFARKMGSETAFTANEAAQALNYMALAGYDTEKSMKMLPQVLNLAAAGNMDLATASDMVTDAQSALGLSIEETETMVDQMAKTSSKTNTSVEQLGEAFLTVGGTAKMMKGGTKELSAVLGVLADNGIKGSEGGTALRNVLLSLSAPTKEASKQINKLGLEVFDAQGNMRSLPDIMDDLNTAMTGMTSEQRTSIINDIFNKRDLKAVEALLGTNKSRWKELYKEIGNAKGAAQQMAETQLDNLEGDVTKFNSALGEAKLTLVEGLTPYLRTFVQKGTSLVQRLTKAFGKDGFAGALKESRAALKEMIAESLGIGADSGWIDIGKAVASKIKNGIIGTISNAKIKIAEFLELENPSDATWGEIAGGIVGRIKTKFNDLKIKTADFLDIDEPSSATWGDIAGKIVGRLKTKFSDIKVKISDMIGVENPQNATWGDFAEKITERIKGKFTDYKIKIADFLQIDKPEEASWNTIGQSIINGFKRGLTNIKLKAADILGIENSSDATWGDIGKNIMDGLTQYISKKGNFIKQLVLGDEFTEESTWKQVGEKISGWLSEAFKDGGLFDVLLQDTADKASAFASFAGDMISGIAKWVSTEAGTEGIVSILSSVAKAIGKAAGPIINALGQIITNPELWTSIGDALKNIVKSVFGENIYTFLFGSDNAQSGWDIYNKIFRSGNPEKYIKENYGDNKSAELLLEKYNEILSKGVADNAIMEQFAQIAKAASEGVDDTKESVEDLGSAVHEVAGDYDINFNINTNGEIPKFGGGAGNHFGGNNTGGGPAVNPTTYKMKAKGDWNVPYDNYPALLHRNEMVLTASQARKYRNGAETSEIVGAVQELRQDLQNLKLVVGAKTFGRAVVDYGGRRMDDYIGQADSRAAAGYGT